MTVDTLSLAKELRAAELSSVQAEAIAAAIGKAVVEGVATKSDVQLLRADLSQAEARLEAKIETVHSRLLTWFIGTQIAVGALIVALLKL
ncbi:hypothetical protein [Sphingomonas profundi]|uniref:hypothetical protein n=1 Tax=Alterirhizorhabdus profundi TaxID=2681549 RepID=UPI0012E83A29|nr:hypothetical protein [Sphingomonas profundi]